MARGLNVVVQGALEHLLAAFFFMCGCPAWWATSRGRAPRSEDDVLMGRWWRCTMGYVARGGRRAR